MTGTFTLVAANDAPGAQGRAALPQDQMICLRDRRDAGPMLRCGTPGPAPQPVQRAAIYARTSGIDPSEPTIFRQIADCRAYCAAQGWEVAGVFIDRDATGLARHRDGYRRMMTAKGRSWDMIVAECPSRLFTTIADAETQAIVLEIMGIGIHTADRGEIKPKRMIPS